MSAAAITSSLSTPPHSSKPLFEVRTVEARSPRALINWKNRTAPSWVTGRLPIACQAAHWPYAQPETGYAQH